MPAAAIWLPCEGGEEWRKRLRYRTAEIDCPFDTVFDLFSDPKRLSEWAIEYCQSVTSVEGGYVAQTVEGARCFDVRSDRTTGVA